MPDTHIYLGDKALTSKQTAALKTKFEKKSLDFEYTNDETAPDGRFLNTKRFKVDLWTEIAKLIQYAPATKALKITSYIDKPGTYNVEIEVFGTTYRGKVNVKQKAGDKTMPAMKPGTNPAKVVVKSKVNKNVLPAEHHPDLNSLVSIMQKTTSYRWVGGSGSHKGWEVDFKPHDTHEQPGHGFKAYIDVSRGLSTTWRLYFDYGYDVKTGALLVQLTNISEDH